MLHNFLCMSRALGLRVVLHCASLQVADSSVVARHDFEIDAAGVHVINSRIAG